MSANPKRRQGRPVRGLDEVGRGRILEATREFLRGSQSLNINRKDLAEFAGVNPALISYYFPSQASLLAEATSPVIKKYVDTQREIIALDVSHEEKVRRLIRFYIRRNILDGRIVDYYRHARSMLDAANTPDYFRVFTDESAEFLRSIILNPMQDSAFIQICLWVVCRERAQRCGAKLQNCVFRDSDDSNDLVDAVLSASVEEIFSLLTDGVRFAP